MPKRIITDLTEKRARLTELRYRYRDIGRCAARFLLKAGRLANTDAAL